MTLNGEKPIWDSGTFAQVVLLGGLLFGLFGALGAVIGITTGATPQAVNISPLRTDSSWELVLTYAPAVVLGILAVFCDQPFIQWGVWRVIGSYTGSWVAGLMFWHQIEIQRTAIRPSWQPIGATSEWIIASGLFGGAVFLLLALFLQVLSNLRKSSCWFWGLRWTLASFCGWCISWVLFSFFTFRSKEIARLIGLLANRVYLEGERTATIFASIALTTGGGTYILAAAVSAFTVGVITVLAVGYLAFTHHELT